MDQASSKPRPGNREAADDGSGVDAANQKTPSTDMQPEDAGTPDSGNTGRGTAAESAMKQTSKTGNETGSKR
jgi:hypothetical protein